MAQGETIWGEETFRISKRFYLHLFRVKKWSANELKYKVEFAKISEKHFYLTKNVNF